MRSVGQPAALDRRPQRPQPRQGPLEAGEHARLDPLAGELLGDADHAAPCSSLRAGRAIGSGKATEVESQ